ncbi:monofunctional biosynthetic peptidoglycan transglycosylase [Thiopseudomonas alkaliphila]|mgnify:CR=1 FL=1|uniref:monofunctional biosynthetic peptidoglycan transglycosylase n=1 Tax=Thiopseudomonas alkaliphila TaxID=1697053 RepID=UPI0025790176|nr:monofunctional biosynthetic peptidoglycan transglycosylase [Thiopseudomonas alkaliphila]MDM1708048.1 monofunctional biosynthetic peptidoglycan transglycosylase [Thiopseudomonas alkaliphila]
MFKKISRWLFLASLIVIGLSIVSVLSLRWVNPPFSMLMLERKLSAISQGQSYALNYQWRDFDSFPDQLKLSVIAAEDQRFAQHRGFDLTAIKAAYRHNKTAATVRGASTLTQQVAKNLFLWSSRSWLRKALEAWFTLWIELFWSKERILTVYLNIAEWGPGIFGAEAAAQYYFQHSAPYLNPQQAALLAASLPSPLTRRPDQPTAQMLNSARWIQQQIRQLGGSHYLTQLKPAPSRNPATDLWQRLQQQLPKINRLPEDL